VWHCVAICSESRGPSFNLQGQIRWKNHRRRQSALALPKTLNLVLVRLRAGSPFDKISDFRYSQTNQPASASGDAHLDAHRGFNSSLARVFIGSVAFRTMTTAEVIYCIKCGTELPREAAYCSECGHRTVRARDEGNADQKLEVSKAGNVSNAAKAVQPGFFAMSKNQFQWLVAAALGMATATYDGITPFTAAWIGASSVNLLIGGAAEVVGRVVGRRTPSAAVAIGVGIFALVVRILS
jgi:ribosomal protein L40E